MEVMIATTTITISTIIIIIIIEEFVGYKGACCVVAQR